MFFLNEYGIISPTEVAVLIFKSNRKTLSVTVARGGEIIVRAPYGISEDYIARFLEKHNSWIEKRVAEQKNRKPLDLSDGKVLTLFGVNYEIATGRPRFSSGKLFLPQEGRERALEAVLKKFSLNSMTLITAEIARRHGFSFQRVRISSARGRWGSCNKDKIIAYTFRIAFLPPQLCEYIVVHELAHTLHLNHSASFWKEVERALPDWKQRRASLRTYAYCMDWMA